MLGRSFFVVLFLALTTAACGTDRPGSGEGSGLITDIEIVGEPEETDEGRIEDRRLTGFFDDGPLEGEFVQEVRGLVTPDDDVTFEGTAVFDGTLEGCGHGTLTLSVVGEGQAGQGPGLPATSVEVEVIDPEGNTLPATGNATLHQNALDLTYEIEYECHG